MTFAPHFSANRRSRRRGARAASWRQKLDAQERITTIMPLPEDESTWAGLDVMFATTSGTVRRNKLSDFVDVRRSGIIAMKRDAGEAIVDVTSARTFGAARFAPAMTPAVAVAATRGLVRDATASA